MCSIGNSMGTEYNVGCINSSKVGQVNNINYLTLTGLARTVEGEDQFTHVQ